MAQGKRAAALVVALGALLALGGFLAGRLDAAPTASPPVIVHVLNPTCTSTNVGSSYSKIGDVGTFTVQSGESLVEATFHGRIYAASTTGTGVLYELRIDDTASSIGRVRATLKAAEVGGGVGRNASMGGFFEGLAPGDHTVSVWARASTGASANTVMYDPGCWSSDHVMVKEYLPFGSVALPAVLSE